MLTIKGAPCFTFDVRECLKEVGLYDGPTPDCSRCPYTLSSKKQPATLKEMRCFLEAHVLGAGKKKQTYFLRYDVFAAE
jgi:hypothetical protein